MSEITVPVGYKNTEVRIIPEDWEAIAIGEALTIKHGKDQKGVESISGKYPIFGTGGQMGWATAFLYDKPSVLIGRKGSINKPKYINVPFWTVDTLFYSQVHNGYDEKFMFYKFCLIDWMNYNEASGVPSLNASTISNVKISVPKKQEQTAIATALSDIDNLIQSLEKLISKREAIKTASMQQLLTGKTRLPEFATREDGSQKGVKQTDLGQIPEDWEVDEVHNLLKITTGNKNTQDKIETGKYPFFVRSQTIERINTYSFDGEGVLTAGDGVGTGKVYHYINGKFDYHQRVYLMHDFGDKLNGYYFYLYFSTNFYDRIMSMNAKSSVDSVRRDMIANMKILFPSKEEQTAIATILSDMDAETQALHARLTKTQDIKQGMMQQLLTGKIRLVDSTNSQNNHLSADKDELLL